MIQTEIDWQARRDQGIQSSSNHTEQDVPGWGELALSNLAMFAFSGLNDPFTIEQFRVWAQKVGLPDPPRSSRLRSGHPEGHPPGDYQEDRPVRPCSQLKRISETAVRGVRMRILHDMGAAQVRLP